MSQKPPGVRKPGEKQELVKWGQGFPPPPLDGAAFHTLTRQHMHPKALCAPGSGSAPTSAGVLGCWWKLHAVPQTCGSWLGDSQAPHTMFWDPVRRKLGVVSTEGSGGVNRSPSVCGRAAEHSSNWNSGEIPLLEGWMQQHQVLLASQPFQ